MTAPGGSLLVLAIVLPIIAMLAGFVAGGRLARGITWACSLVMLGVVGGIVATVWTSGQAVVYRLGGWMPPLGITLRADGLSAVMLAITALIMTAVALYAPARFSVAKGAPESRVSLVFWTMFAGLWTALNSLWLASDFFSLYVALELLAFAAIPLVALDGSAATLRAALNYLLFALLGSVLYLLGAVLFYGQYGTLDLELLREAVAGNGPTLAAVALMTAGLAAKTALFPFHFWLPPAHAGATPAASALLSALVVKGSFFLIVRLWFDVVPELNLAVAAQVLGWMGAGAILVGGGLALGQGRLKLLIAYSTIAQIGYLFLMFPLESAGGAALTGGMFQAVAHALAKASMFLGAGLVVERIGHDRIAAMRGLFRLLPVTMVAFLIASLSLIGVPPTGGFVAKWLLLAAVVTTGQWWWAVVMVAGGLLTGTYLFRVIATTLREGDPVVAGTVSRAREFVVLALAIGSLLVGLLSEKPLELLRLGQPELAAKEVPR